MPARFYSLLGAWDPDKGLPFGARARRVHPGNAYLQGYTLCGALGYYCWECGARPKGRISGPRGAAALHRHEQVCASCAGPVLRVASLLNREWCVCSACAQKVSVTSQGLSLLVVETLEETTCAGEALGHAAVLPDQAPTLPLVTIALGGIWADRTGTHVHSDTARFNALRGALGPRVKLFGVAHGSPSLQTTLITLAADVRRDESWYSSRTNRDASAPQEDTITGRGATIFVLDYFWVPKEYLVDQHFTSTLGYGARWFSDLIPLFFRHGGQIVLLPNDKNGLIVRMHTAARTPSSSFSLTLLTAAEARLCHPLYSATDTITDFDTGLLRGAASSHGGDRSNATQVRAHLNSTNPFCLVYNTAHFASAHDACALLRRLASC